MAEGIETNGSLACWRRWDAPSAGLLFARPALANQARTLLMTPGASGESSGLQVRISSIGSRTPPAMPHPTLRKINRCQSIK